MNLFTFSLDCPLPVTSVTVAGECPKEARTDAIAAAFLDFGQSCKVGQKAVKCLSLDPEWDIPSRKCYSTGIDGKKHHWAWYGKKA